jgi:hypothetical protein
MCFLSDRVTLRASGPGSTLADGLGLGEEPGVCVGVAEGDGECVGADVGEGVGVGDAAEVRSNLAVIVLLVRGL